MKILVISPRNKSIFNFRGDLIKDMIKNHNEVYAVGPNEEFLDDIYALGIRKFFSVKLERNTIGILNDISYFLKLKKLIKELKPDMVFSYTIKPVIYGSIAAGANKVKNIYAMVPGLGRMFGKNGFKAGLLKRMILVLYKKAFKYCNSVIFQNPTDLQEMVKNKCLQIEKTAVVNGSGVNMQRFVRTELPPISNFLMAARIIREKGVFEYCEAARKVKKMYPEASFVLLGGLDNSNGAITLEDLKPYIDDGSVQYLGEVKDPVSYYNRASAFVLPSYYREGLPRTILEAMSCGRCVITTDWPGCREAIEDGVNGFLVPIKDVDALAEKIKLLLDNPEKLEQMAENAYQTCKSKYEINIVNAQMRAVMKY